MSIKYYARFCSVCAFAFGSFFLLQVLRAGAETEPVRVSAPSRIDGPNLRSFPESELERLTAAGLGRFSQGDFTGAVAEFTNAIKINPKRGSLYLQRGLANLELNKFKAALDDLDNAYEYDKSNKNAILVCRGRAFTGLKKYKLALADLDEAIKEDPHFTLALISRADVYLQTANDEKAMADLEHAIELDPKQAKAYLLRARYYKNKKQTNEAMSDFKKAVLLDSTFLERDYGPKTQADRELTDNLAKSLNMKKKKQEVTVQMIERGLAAERSGEYLQAIREFTDAITDAPDALEAYKWRASVYMHMSNFEPAIADLGKAIEISPKDPNLYAKRAKAYLEYGKGGRAIEDYSKAIEVSSPAPSSLYEARGLAYSRMGQSENAVKDFTKSIELDPEGSTAYADRGLEHMVENRYDEAIKDFSDSIERKQDLAVCYKFRGQCKNYLADRKGAIADLEKAAALYKENSDLFGNRQIEKMISEIKKGRDKTAEDTKSERAE